jgi:lysozyme
MTAPQNCNAQGLAIIRMYEGLRLNAYRCPAGFWTIGYGHTLTAQPEQKITTARAEELLQNDLRRFEQGISRLVKMTLNDNQFSALVSFTFNIGLGAFAESTLLQLLNRGWYTQVPAQIKRWNKIKGRPSSGLTRRRQAEAALWQQKDA